MAFEVSWFDENAPTILYIKVIDRWQWREFDDALAQMDVLMQTANAPRPLDMIFDITRMSLLPIDFARRFKRDYLERELYVRCVAVLGADEYIRVIWSVLAKLIQQPNFTVSFADDLEAALEQLGRCSEPT